VPEFDVKSLSDEELAQVQNDVLRTLLVRAADPGPIGPHDSHKSVHSRNTVNIVEIVEELE